MSSKSKKIEVIWEDEEVTTPAQGASSPKDSDEDFSSLLKEYEFDTKSFRPGDRVTGTITHLSNSSNEVLIQLSSRHTGFMEKSQITNAEGELLYRPNDSIEAYIVERVEGSFQLSMTMERSKKAADDLLTAMHNQIPVMGKVIGENKGGFDVTIFGKQAFCPVSQIDSSFVENKAPYIGKDFDFLIVTVENHGRNILVSRSKLLKIAAEKRLAELKENLKPDLVLDGIIKEIREYGAFVDLGGMDGFLHISELSYSRVTKIRDFLTSGEKIRVKILAIEEKDGKTRLSLSMKAVEQDPWLVVTSEFSSGEQYKGTVTRLAKFGAFVELKPGVEGLLHLQEMSWQKRILKPEEVVQVGDTVHVRILDINPTEKRISLSLKDIEADPWNNIDLKYPKGTEIKGKVERLKGYGAVVEIAPGLTGLIPTNTLKRAFGEGFRRKSSPPQEITVRIGHVDAAAKRILLSLPEVESESDDLGFQEYFMESQRKQEEAKFSGKLGSFGALLEKKLNKGSPRS